MFEIFVVVLILVVCLAFLILLIDLQLAERRIKTLEIIVAATLDNPRWVESSLPKEEEVK